MWKLHRYYLKELAVNATITFVVVFAVVLVSLVPRVLQKSLAGDLYEAALITLLTTVDSFPHLLTIAFLIATVLTFSRAAQDRELTAIRAAGISPRVPMTAAVLAGIVLSVAGSVAMHYLIPEVHYRRFRVIAEAIRNVVSNFKLNSDRIRLPNNEDYVLTFRRCENGYFVDCTIYCPPGKSIEGLTSPIVKVDRVSIPKLSLHSDAIVIDLEGVRDPLEGTTKGKLTTVFDLGNLADKNRRPDQNEDLQSDQLLAEVLRGVHPRPNDALYVLFRRCCFALMPLLLAPIGFCLAELTRERGRVMALVVALVPLAAFYIGDMMGARLMFGTDNPWYAWLPAVLMTAIGAPVCWRQMHR
jgi:lipopolysaccharide export LptBFGC system permease protein LptF